MSANRNNDSRSAAVSSLELPLLPVFFGKIFKLLLDPDVSIERIKRLFNSDERFYSGVQRMAASGLFGPVVQGEPFSKTILRLGLPTIRNIIEVMSVRHVFKRTGVMEELLWMQMVGSATASRAVASKTRLVEPEDAFTTGLFHDLGKVVLLNNIPDAYERIFKDVSAGKGTFLSLETNRLGFSHRDLGSRMVKTWGYPDTLSDFILRYDSHEQTIQNRYSHNLVIVITAADRICMKLGIGWKRPFDAMDFGNLTEALGLDDSSLAELIRKINDEFANAVDLYLY